MKIIGAAALLALTGTWCAAQDPSTQTESLPVVRPVKGDLLLWKSSEGKAGPLAKETRIAPADRLGTRDGDYAAFSTEGGTIVALKGVRSAAERGLGIELREKKVIFRVFEGKLAVQTFEQGVKIETPQGLIAANKSYFLVEVEKDKTKVVAVDGDLTFTNSLGSVAVEPGRETVAETGKKPSTPKPADVGKATEEFTRSEAASNLIKNPGFEDGLKEWGPTWFNIRGKRHTEAETAVAHSGRSCVRLDLSTKIQGAPGRHRFAAQYVPAVVGKTYLFRVYLRSEIREGQVTPLVGLGGIESPDVFRVSCDKAWRMKTAIVTAKVNQLMVALEVDVESDRFEGSIWVDDFFLSELPSPDKGK